jgi:polar amino acid transport system substrate-binding protein
MNGSYRRLLGVVVMTGLLASACTSGAGSPSSQASATATASASAIAAPASLLKAGELSLCTDPTLPPMEYYEASAPNTAVGFDVEEYEAIAKKLGLSTKIVSTPFAGLIPALAAGRCDLVIAALYISEKRLQVADAVPYLATAQLVLVPTGNPKNIKAEADLCGKSVSFQLGGFVEDSITATSKKCTDNGQQAIKLQGYPTTPDVYQQIAIGRVDAVTDVDVVVIDFERKNPGKYEVAFTIPGSDRYGIYYRKGKTDVGAALTAALKVLKDDGTLAALAMKYGLDPANLSAIK